MNVILTFVLKCPQIWKKKKKKKELHNHLESAADNDKRSYFMMCCHCNVLGQRLAKFEHAEVLLLYS